VAFTMLDSGDGSGEVAGSTFCTAIAGVLQAQSAWEHGVSGPLS
jgi:hypothetical protein